ncbi:hypothetical protein LEP1GSC132_3314 [Leptospira kirschneri str. 200803703]|nr:hypothetical protein LEP1GSC122_2663 [Leptospira kirschneri serovar Valbuzzi str. 200702274]EMO67554.1 hypothetical protein LEP1GSC132_3314 [Leptospira kirschneri str. 200803703]
MLSFQRDPAERPRKLSECLSKDRHSGSDALSFRKALCFSFQRDPAERPRKLSECLSKDRHSGSDALSFRKALCFSFQRDPAERPMGSHNLTHKYLDFNIKSCGNYDKSSVKLSSHPYFWVGAEVEKFGKLFFIRKTYFSQVKSLILVGTLEKCEFFNATCRTTHGE